MKILLTNDDGINAEGLFAIYKELKKIAQVIVVAPDSQRSSVGQAITLASILKLEKVRIRGKFSGYSTNGTTADCVKMAIKLILKKKPDAVVSGINLGPNEGCSVYYSGTVGGAREGALLGIPSLAVSLSTFSNPDFAYAAKLGTKLVKTMLKNQLPRGTFLNLNVPNKPKKQIKGIKITEQCMVPIHTTFHKKKAPNGHEYYWMSGDKPNTKRNLCKDTDALNQDYVTITPIQCDSTDYAFIKMLKSWKF